MPEAEPFGGGRGNGFPFCLSKVNVTDIPPESIATESDWLTLGGTRKGSTPTSQEISLSLVNAMNLFWNLSSATFTEIGEIPMGRYKLFGDTSVDSDLLPPLQQVCATSRIGIISNGAYTRFCQYREVDPGISSIDYNCGSRIYRMYNGDTSNENNFVGYGCDLSDLFRSEDGGISKQTSYRSHFFIEDSFFGDEEVEVTSTSVENLPFLKLTYTIVGQDDFSQPDLLSLDFYTYP
jgi:hypothetical protein